MFFPIPSHVFSHVCFEQYIHCYVATSRRIISHLEDYVLLVSLMAKAVSKTVPDKTKRIVSQWHSVRLRAYKLCYSSDQAGLVCFYASGSECCTKPMKCIDVIRCGLCGRWINTDKKHNHCTLQQYWKWKLQRPKELWNLIKKVRDTKLVVPKSHELCCWLAAYRVELYRDNFAFNTRSVFFM